MTYSRPADRAGALRLHLNENTGGCSPMVIDAIRRLSAEQVASYPDYEPLVRECAQHLGVAESRVVLTNGLDEGLLAVTVSAFAASPADGPFEAVIPTPAFEMYSVFVKAAGGRVVFVPPIAGFAFPTDSVLAAVNERTRVIFLTNPNNPTGQLIPRESIRRIARNIPSSVTIALDEAYYDFCGETFLPDLAEHPNVVIGRTFAKAYGLAGLRAGCLIGEPDRLTTIRPVVPPYSVSVFAEAGWRAALRDRPYLDWYRGEVAESRELLYAACDRLALPYWKSAGNFVLINIGQRGQPGEIAEAFAKRGILVRNRSHDPGCDGCIRITAGVVRHTRMAIDALEELCAAR